jgi:hypothetical protein
MAQRMFNRCFGWGNGKIRVHLIPERSQITTRSVDYHEPFFTHSLSVSMFLNQAQNIASFGVVETSVESRKLQDHRAFSEYPCF